MNYTFDTIRDKGLLLYEYIRGSQAYGLALPTSDEDRGAVFCMKTNDIFGLPEYTTEQVNDERNDTTWYEIGKYIDLLCKANPTMLESLFVPERCIVHMHPVFKVIYKNRDVFVTKETFSSFCGYAKSQISKARGLNKKIVRPITNKKDILDFCYTFKEQGTEPFKKFLEKNGLFAKYCGMVHLPNMEQMYGVYYDFGNHFHNEGISCYNECPQNLRDFIKSYFESSPISAFTEDLQLDNFVRNTEPIGYRGACDEVNSTTQLRLSSVSKGEKPIAHISFNDKGFSQHCKQYKEYNEWVEHRNPQRFLENQGKEFDRKNMMHCTRLLNMGIEIAKTGKVNVDRTNIDREFLLKIRLGDATYEDLIANLDAKFEELNRIKDSSAIPESVDREAVNKILISIRKKMNNPLYMAYANVVMFFQKVFKK